MLAAICTAEAAQKIIKIACVGDSITAGNGIKNKEMDTYPAVLQEMLGAKFEVKNFGSSGRTLLKKGDSPYWNDGNLKKSLEFLPDIVIVKLGTNDSKPQNWRYKDEFDANMRELLSMYKNLPTNPKIYLCTPMFVAREAWGITEPVVHNEVCTHVKKIAAAENLKLVDLHSMFESKGELLCDGIHPNEAGAMRMAGIFYKILTGKNPPKLEPIRGKKFDEGGYVRLEMPLRTDFLNCIYPKSKNEEASWLWVADDFKKLSPEQKNLLKNGWQIMFWKTPATAKKQNQALDWANEFYFYGRERFGLGRKFVLDFSGASAGFALSFAEKYSDRISFIILRNPEVREPVECKKIAERGIPIRIFASKSDKSARALFESLKDCGAKVEF